MSKLTKHEREELKSLILDATIRRLTAKETSVFVFEKLGVSISVDHIRHLKTDLKRDCAKELLLLQKDREYYLQRMFFDRVQELQYQQRVLHEVIDKNKESSPDVVIRAVNVLHGITVNMNRLFQGLPVSTFYIPSCSIPSDDANGQQQQRQRWAQQQPEPKLAWEDDPTFAGMPGSNLDENYNPRPKPVYDESDMP